MVFYPFTVLVMFTRFYTWHTSCLMTMTYIGSSSYFTSNTICVIYVRSRPLDLESGEVLCPISFLPLSEFWSNTFCSFQCLAATSQVTNPWIGFVRPVFELTQCSYASKWKFSVSLVSKVTRFGSERSRGQIHSGKGEIHCQSWKQMYIQWVSVIQ